MAFDLAAVKKGFFDSKAVTDKIDPATKKALSKFGAFVRQRARQSIKRRKGSSPAGSPPFAHSGEIKLIYFSYDPDKKSVVIGPVLAGPKSGATENLEYGGTATVKLKTKTKTVQYAPHPFMTPAFLAERGNAAAGFKDMIK